MADPEIIEVALDADMEVLEVALDSDVLMIEVSDALPGARGERGPQGPPPEGAGGVELDPVATAALMAHATDPQFHPTPLVRPSLALIYANKLI